MTATRSGSCRRRRRRHSPAAAPAASPRRPRCCPSARPRPAPRATSPASLRRAPRATSISRRHPLGTSQRQRQRRPPPPQRRRRPSWACSRPTPFARRSPCQGCWAGRDRQPAPAALPSRRHSRPRSSAARPATSRGPRSSAARPATSRGPRSGPPQRPWRRNTHRPPVAMKVPRRPQPPRRRRGWADRRRGRRAGGRLRAPGAGGAGAGPPWLLRAEHLHPRRPAAPHPAGGRLLPGPLPAPEHGLGPGALLLRRHRGTERAPGLRRGKASLSQGRRGRAVCRAAGPAGRGARRPRSLHAARIGIHSPGVCPGDGHGAQQLASACP
mmetsp:Transcript_102956/g.320835  ORF Transcript_102956/g.320835 Transcript_102956/m.320835 type:complete len:327 (+) Transcript_102956:719-1699(+)